MTDSERKSVLSRLLDAAFVRRRKRLYASVANDQRAIDYLASIEREMTNRN